MSDELKLVCPECGYIADAAVALAWGDGVQDVPVAPYICAGCGTASIVNLVTRKVEAVSAHAWEVVKEHNPTLWAKILEAQGKIRAIRAREKRTESGTVQ
jgi:hypothetical protein